jgi:hypothetical protein
VLLHDGFWRMGFNRTLMNPLALVEARPSANRRD